jgi:putative YhdH/YhfP family quinone oxidoreductase
VPEEIRAFVSAPSDGADHRGLRAVDRAELGDGDLLVRVAWSGVNYKDALAASHDGRVARINPLIPGVDLSGTVVESSSAEFPAGTAIIAHGYDLGVAHHGGYAELARIPAAWALPLPAGLSLREAMVLGTAGFTAAMSVDAIEARGARPADGPVLVTGATGGVGSCAVAILSGLGYEVHASTGKADAHDFLRGLGAAEIVGRDELAAESRRPLETERWAGAVDCVGGTTLAAVLRGLRYGASVAACGLTGGAALNTTVLPFILRGVSLLGIDSVQVEMPRRREIWARAAQRVNSATLAALADEVALDDVEDAIGRLLSGQGRGRTVVRVGGDPT